MGKQEQGSGSLEWTWRDGRQPVTGLHSDVGGSGSCAWRPEGTTICRPRPTEIPKSVLKTAFFIVLLNTVRRHRWNSGHLSSGATLCVSDENITYKKHTINCSVLLVSSTQICHISDKHLTAASPVWTRYPCAFLRFQHEAQNPLAKGLNYKSLISPVLKLTPNRSNSWTLNPKEKKRMKLLTAISDEQS